MASAFRAAMKFQRKSLNRIWSSPDLSLLNVGMVAFQGETQSRRSRDNARVKGVAVAAPGLTVTNLFRLMNLGRQVDSLLTRAGFGGAPQAAASIRRVQWIAEGAPAATALTVIESMGHI